MSSGRENGFSYLGLMIFIAIAGVALAGIGSLSSMQAKREKEAQLLFVGEQFRNAIASYYQNTPGEAKQYPATLEDLLEDRRFPVPRRHLRRIYLDPVTNTQEWGLVKAGERITGVYSLSQGVPGKRAGFPERYKAFEEAKSYQDWKFLGTATAATEPVAVAAVTAKVPPATAPVTESGGTTGTGTASNGATETPAAAPPAAATETPSGSCSEQLAADKATCASVCSALQARDCSFCQRSALIRNSACRSGRGMPALDTTP